MRCALLLVAGVGAALVPKQQGNAPDARQRHDGIDDTADKTVLPAADPRHEVKLEQTDAAPVERTDDGQDQCNSIHADHDSFYKLFIFETRG